MVDISNTSIWSQVDASNSSAGSAPGFPEAMSPSSVDNNMRGVMGAVARWFSRTSPTITSTGSANAQTLNYSVSPLSYVLGDVYQFIAGYTNSGPATLKVNALSDISIHVHGLPLVSGEIVAGTVAAVAYDSTGNFQLLNPQNRVFGNLHVTGDEIIDGNLTVTNLTVTGNETVTGTLHVVGNATFDHNVSVEGTLDADDAVIDTLHVTDLSTDTLTVGGSPISVLSADETYYIATSGSDSNDGSAAHPYATLQHAYNVAVSKTIFGNHVIILRMSSGNYTLSGTALNAGAGNWIVRSATGNADDVVISVTGLGMNGFLAYGSATLSVENVTVGALLGYACACTDNAILELNSVNVTASKGHINSYDGGHINIRHSYVIKGSAEFHYSVNNAMLKASTTFEPISVVTSAGVTFSTAFAVVADGGFMRSDAGVYTGVSMTGVQYLLSSNGIIETSGQAKATYFPPFDNSGTIVTQGLWI